jgi:hypothetical protein
MTTEQRRFHRILFDAPVRIREGDNEHITTLVDISLNGALVLRPETWSLQRGDSVRLIVLLDDSKARIHMQTEVAHQSEDTIGLRCVTIDMESIGHLRRLVELNLGDQTLLERDLTALG